MKLIKIIVGVIVVIIAGFFLLMTCSVNIENKRIGNEERMVLLDEGEQILSETVSNDMREIMSVDKEVERNEKEGTTNYWYRVKIPALALMAAGAKTNRSEWEATTETFVKASGDMFTHITKNGEYASNVIILCRDASVDNPNNAIFIARNGKLYQDNAIGIKP